jgi:microcompartment protein CcmL/EutN
VTEQSNTVTGPALAMLDVADIPPGLRALDALAKEAPVTVLGAGTIQCGRYLILFAGEVEPVGYAYRKACESLGSSLLDDVLLPHAEARVVPAVSDGAVRWPAPGDTLGALQAGSSPTMLAAVDAALKGTEVELVQLRAADGLGGKAIAMLWGETHAVEAAVALCHQAFAHGRSDGCTSAVVRNADVEVGRAMTPWSGFYSGWRG